MSQHAELTPERWSRFTLGQQVLQIAAEMIRGRSSMVSSDPTSRKGLLACYERALRLVDLTVQVQSKRNLRRELLRWRGVVAELYLRAESDPELHDQALSVLLDLHPEAYGQRTWLGLAG